MNSEAEFIEPLIVVGTSSLKPVLPIICDSPHSAQGWPDSVPTTASVHDLMTSCDAHIDDLWVQACAGRAPLLAARFHRAYIDVNRAINDVDPAMLTQPWPTPLSPSEKSDRGFGLIRRLALPGVPIYAERLTVEDVQARIFRYYDPYHHTLASLIDDIHRQFGMCMHLDCHSMKSVGNAMNTDEGQSRPDMVVSDLDGTTCPPDLTQLIAEFLRKTGYKVTVNDPYKGGELIKRHSKPAARRFSVQIEINRHLYMNEMSFERSKNYISVVRNLHQFISDLGANLLSESWGLVPRV